MSHEILISADETLVKTAIVKEGQLVDIHVEPAVSENKKIGQIYLAEVERVVPNLQAAFLNIGEDRSAFLGAREAKVLVEDPDRDTSIGECVEEGDELLVQIVHPASGGKGASVTADISLPGRFVVLTLCRSNIAISRSIENETERQRLIDLATSVQSELEIEGLDGAAGWIIRTVAENIDTEALKQDMQMVAQIWHGILSDADDMDAPYLLHYDIGGVERVLRDMLRHDTKLVTIEGQKSFEQAQKYCQKFMPDSLSLLQQSEKTEKLFDRHDIYGEIEIALSPRVDLPSGGWIMIETTEAMTTIDINSGKQNAEALAVNLESVKAIHKQINLRAIGGLIAIDFIDMVSEDDKQAVEQEIQKIFADDKVHVRISNMSDFGVIEMTRKRSRIALKQALRDS